MINSHSITQAKIINVGLLLLDGCLNWICFR